ncbi:MAG TPA: hypothetical protein EYN30_03015, partial [Candidatus Poseidoniales archaeon]|nr:hypothetical protein [Candidatus Poseidoniales archaeon]
MDSHKNLKPLLLATLMLLMTQAGSLYGFNDSMNDQNPVLNELEGQFFVGGTSLSPAYTNVTLINNTAMSPITFNWTGSGMTSGVPVAIGQGRPYQNMAYEMDSNDNHHIVHYGGTSLHGLYYTTDTSGSWTTSLVEAGSTYALGFHSDIAIDSNDDLHVVYTAGYPYNDMNYTSFSNGVWSTPITIDGTVGREMAMDIDSNDALHIVSNEYAVGGATNYSTNSGGSWSTVTVYSNSWRTPRATDIELDSNGDVFIILTETRQNQNNKYLQLINNTGGSWNSQLIDTDPGLSYYNVELTIDSNDVKHTYYHAGGGNGSTQANIVVRNDASGSWSGNLLPHPQGQPIQLGDMTMESNGTIHIVYKYTFSPTTYFYYATNISGSWVFKELANISGSSVAPSYEVLELDSQGNLHYFFRNGSVNGNGTLFHLVENGVSTVGGSGGGGGGSGSTTSQANGTPWQVADINPGAGNSGAGATYPSAVSKGFVLVGTTVYFSASDGTNGSELWAYNSSNGTTWLVADINPSGSSYSGRHGGFNLVGTTLYFDADDGTTGRELWAHNTSNGTTWRVANINSGDSNTARFYGITLVGTTLFFDADDGGLGRELWAHDTSNGTTWMTFDIYNGSTGGLDGSQTPFAVVGTTLYFEAQSGTQYEHLWAHNTSNGTSWLVSDLVQDPGALAGFTIIGDTLYFDATAYYSPYTGNELWAHNTSNGTTWIAADVAVGPNGGNPGDLTGFHVIGDVILFDCSPSFGSSGKLGAYNTSNGTIWLINSSYKNIGSNLFKAMGNTLYFGSMITGGSNTLLYAYSTTNTTIWDIPIPGSYSNQPGFQPGFSKNAAIVGDVLYFDARRAVYGDRGLAAYNESNGTAWMVGDRSDYTLPYSGFHPTLVGGMLLFQATDGSNGSELWALGSGNVASGPSNGPVSSATCEISPTLPVGITLTQGTCTISGTPTVVQNGTTYTIWANESGYSDWATVVISVISGDSDGDGYPDIIDAFPNDPTEWIDTDGDGIGNNADPDDDNDSYNDTNEIDCLSDPLDNVSIPLDNDLDGICDELDPDDDNDGLEDVNETASLPATDPFLPDTDGDGVCDGPVAINGTCTAGPDAFPTDPSEWLDTDGDGIGNNADTDDDGDGLDDVNETNTGIYVGANDTGTDPLLPDTDGDGICDGPIAVDPICTIGPDAFPMDPSEWV